jgi:hypothetical protein
MPPRFFGYYFQEGSPLAVGASWTVSLENTDPVAALPDLLVHLTDGRFSIVSRTRHVPPDYILVHDRCDGACWLWSFAEGLKFIEAVDPFTLGLEVPDRKLLGP